MKETRPTLQRPWRKKVVRAKVPSVELVRTLYHSFASFTNNSLEATFLKIVAVYANDPQHGLNFSDNEVLTSKYTVFNFLFKFLWTKFRYEIANQYFLLICVLQAIPAISITGGIPTTAAPLAFVLFVDGFFTAVQDYNRHVADRHVNLHSVVPVIRGGEILKDPVSWKDVRVGDIVKVKQEERFPCDMLCLGAGRWNVDCSV